MWGFLICTQLSHKFLICLYFLNKLGLLFFSLQNYQVLRYHGDGKKQTLKKTDSVLFNWNANPLFHTGNFSQNDHTDKIFPKVSFVNSWLNAKLSFVPVYVESKQRKNETLEKKKIICKNNINWDQIILTYTKEQRNMEWSENYGCITVMDRI